jgi:hypothetical protein
MDRRLRAEIIPVTIPKNSHTIDAPMARLAVAGTLCSTAGVTT